MEINHNGHKYDSLKDIASKKRLHLEEEIKPLQDRQNILSKARETIQVTRTEIKDQGESVQRVIDQSFQEMQDILEKHRKKLQAEALQKIQEKLKYLSEQEKDLNVAIESIDSLKILVEQNLKTDEVEIRIEGKVGAGKSTLVSTFLNLKEFRLERYERHNNPVLVEFYKRVVNNTPIQ